MVTKGTVSLFSSAAFDANTARINRVASYGLDIFATAYKTAADTLVGCVLEQGADADTLVYPIVFLYRHYLELRLKEILREGSLLLDEDRDFKEVHPLLDHWPFVKSIIQRVWAHEPEDASDEMALVEDILTQFDAIDRQSMAFRYPGLLPGVEEINLRQLSETIERAYYFLEGVSDAICAYRDS